MHKPKYTKLDANLEPLPDDHPNEGDGKHLAVRVEHPLLVGSIIVSAYRASDRSTSKDAKVVAEKFSALGKSWRLPSVEEAFFISDRTRSEVGLDPNFFPDADSYEPTWTADVDSTSPSGFAWSVNLGVGYCDWDGQSLRDHVRPVLAGQS